MAKRRSRARKAATRTRAPRAAEPFGVYANHAQAQWGATEINLVLSQTHPKGAEWPVVEVSRITVPVITAKVLAFALLTEIAAYEAVLGPVNVARQLTPDMPVSHVFAPETIARLAILHAELFAPVPPPAPPPPKTDLSPGVTKH